MPVPRIPALALGLGLAALVGPALAQPAPASSASPLLRPVPVSVAEVPPGAMLVPPAVFGGAGYGYSGRGYYFDGPGEGPLLTGVSTRRTAPHRVR